MPKEKLPPKKVIKKVLWFFISVYVRLRDTDETWYWKCISCPKRYYRRHDWHTKDWLEAWHFIANAICKFLTYNLDNLNVQCYQCNDMKHWNYPRYEDWLIEKIWLEKVNYLKQNKNTLKARKDYELMEMIREFQWKCYEIIQTKNKWLQIEIVDYIKRNIPKKRLCIDFETLIHNK